MGDGLFITKARLRCDASFAALANLLVPDSDGARTAASHRLVWSLFADTPGRARDFLWREEGPGRFLALSLRPPNAMGGLFDVDCKPFDPKVSPGNRLGFTLRANATISRCTKDGKRGARHDVVMDALSSVAPHARAKVRASVATGAGNTWLARQGEAHGFTLDGSALVDGCNRVTIPRHAQRPAVLGVLDISGVLTVTDPLRFVPAVVNGFGKAKAFGYGLMLLRRVH